MFSDMNSQSNNRELLKNTEFSAQVAWEHNCNFMSNTCIWIQVGAVWLVQWQGNKWNPDFQHVFGQEPGWEILAEMVWAHISVLTGIGHISCLDFAYKALCSLWKLFQVLRWGTTEATVGGYDDIKEEKKRFHQDNFSIYGWRIITPIEVMYQVYEEFQQKIS